MMAKHRYEVSGEATFQFAIVVFAESEEDAERQVTEGADCSALVESSGRRTSKSTASCVWHARGRVVDDDQ